MSLREFLSRESAVIREAHFGGANGSEIVQRRTGLIDRILRDAHSRLETINRMPALIAVGGYGRGELNPHSDIDIMFLCRDEIDRARSPELLYQLWDAGLDIGYSVRTIKECIALAHEDVKIRTSLMESRLIAGQADFYQSYAASLQSEVFYWKPAAFINQKIAERNAVRQKYGGSLYLREPNIKECSGGLRDVHIALWAAIVHFKVQSFSELIEKGVVTETQFRTFMRSRNFLWRVRNEIHYLSGRKNDHLTFDLQEQAARDFNYRDSAHLLAVERFMKAYFIHARTVREFSNNIIDAVLPKRPRLRSERKQPFGPFTLIGKTIAVAADSGHQQDLPAIMTAFQTVQSKHAVFSEKLKSLVRSFKVDDNARRSPDAAQIFLAILDNPVYLFETLALMKDLRLLGRYIPEFKAVQALARHDYYHLYAVDEHLLLAIRNLQDLLPGTFPSLSTLREAFAGLHDRWRLTLAVLLHDLGKAYRSDHENHGVKIGREILARLGVGDKDAEKILFLVQNHLVMSNLSQRRELSDAKVIADFARLVRDRENLVMLYLLTYADISAVNPTAWTQWKAALLHDLYVKTLNHFDSSTQTAEEAQNKLVAASVRIRKAAEGLLTPRQIDDFLVTMPDQYILQTPSLKVVDHMKMVQLLPDEKLVVRHRHYPERGYTELSICAYDAYGMFYRTAGTIAAKNLNILKAQVYTSRNGVMIDTFQITDPDGNLYPYDDAWDSVRQELRAALMNRISPPDAGVYASARRMPGVIIPLVEFDNETSDAFTIIDVTARDMVGFLYRVTKALYELNLDIASAKIVTEGARAMDSFYVTDLFGKKITDVERLQKIRTALRSVIE